MQEEVVERRKPPLEKRRGAWRRLAHLLAEGLHALFELLPSTQPVIAHLLLPTQAS